ncbi:hypothetical protein GOP47_0011897 [Adiantum capillus-veneris]|uniref:J domain-containing protein n=1 Tax=Adiantum capillus-veneris TaxID=13818 RepID=A0A9D4ZFT9_ADICA|nr:hypothetical protein GOP47_0011897 [Adiantum capillus-veneris]
MECNKEEAEKCKAISEAFLKKLDLAAARKFALKAKQLFPELDGLAQLSSILDVYIAAQQKLRSGECNWYAILQVDFRADENTIRKQYRKLALFLHPDKNKAFGAEAAFKNISEAWSVLSDAKKKKDYDKRWFAHLTTQRAHHVTDFQARGNISKQQMYGVRQSQQHMHQNQFHRQAQQGQSHVHQKVPQGQGQVHTNLPQRHTLERQGPSPANAHQQQGQGHTHTHQQQQAQWQVRGHANQQPRQGQASIQQQGQAQAQEQQEKRTHLQQCPGQPNAHQQERKGQADASWQCQQDHASTHKQWQSQQPGQGEALARQQEEQGQMQGQGHAHQQLQEEAHALQRKVHVQQSQGHQQEEQVKMHVEEQEKGEENFSAQGQHQRLKEQGQGQEYGHQQPGQGEARASRKHEEEEAERKQAHLSKPATQEKSAFWTACPHCKIQLEYEKTYMNKNMCCPMCYRPFVSKEIEPIQGAVLWQRPMRQSSEKDAGNKSCTVNVSQCILKGDSKVAEIVHCDKKANRDELDNTSQEDSQKTPEATVFAEKGAKRQEQKGKVGIRKTFGVRRILASMKVGVNEECLKERENPARAHVGDMIEEKTKENGTAAVHTSLSRSLHEQSGPEQNISVKGRTDDSDECKSRVRTRNSAKSKEIGVSMDRYAAGKVPASMLAAQNIPAALGRKEIVEATVNDIHHSNLKVRSGHSAGPKETGGSQKVSRLGSSEMESPQLKRKLSSSTIDDLECIGTMKRLRRMSNHVEPACKFDRESEGHQPPNDGKSSDRSFLQVNVPADTAPVECEMEVPDADFYNFDEDRTERHFAVGQIWATYDDDDGMPRYYARVNKILSTDQFKLQMNWLEARNPTDETVAWLEAGFQHSCGDFKLGTVYMADQVSTFSHLMMVDKMSKGGYKIYPRKGEVWAVYKEWEFLKVRDDHRGYDMVEVMATFDEERGVQVAQLFKVAGFKTVFERKPGEEYMKWIPLHETRRFSHQVPAHPVVAGKVPGIQVDCLEIDPASTPMNLINGEQ